MDSVLLKSFPSVPSITTGSYAPKSSWHRRKMQKEHNFLSSSRLSLNHYYKGNEQGFTCQPRNRNYVMKEDFGQYSEHIEPQSIDRRSILNSVAESWDVFYRFARPYAFIVLAINTVSASFMAVEKLSDISPLFYINVLQIVMATMFMHIYVNGVNQFYDLEIDKINKPYLPMASGEYSIGTGVILTFAFLTLSFLVSWSVGSWPFFWTLFALFLLGTGYSIDLPLLRWKSSALGATLCISMQAIVPQLGFFLHMQTQVFKRPILFPKRLIFALAFLCLFFMIVANLKDLPDAEGDKKFGVKSLSVLLGSKLVFWSSVYLLELAYAVSTLVSISSPFLWSKIITGLGHVICAAILWHNARSVDLENNASTSSFYMLIWKLAFVEHFLIPLIR